ncbi:MAG TPA: right-handed parallel beta-helix repeat-containing protein [Acidimicrobiia bacterium]|nr:right-handed parallel beta-helix repeat-containing protein [Acidimicrobiia bacterium]
MNKRLINATSIIAISLCALAILSSCSSTTKETKNTNPKVLAVSSGDSIQEVIDAAQSGDVVLIDSGTYTGDIVVTTPDITIRGEDRNDVIIDGKYKQDNGIVVAANGVRVENLTVQSFKTNGILFQGGYEIDDQKDSTPEVLDRYQIQHVNALSNGLYGIYAFASKNGVINNTYSSGNADAGIYIGQCKPCNTLVYQNVAEINGIGMQGANASQELYIYANDFSNNRTGIQFLSETKEKKAPQEAVYVVSNKANDNNQALAPATNPDLFGFGIVISGGNDNFIQSNLTKNNARAGIMLVENGTFLPNNNTFENNLSRENGVPFGFDIAYLISGRPDVMSLGNCFQTNSFSSSSIDKIESVLPCTGSAPGPFKSQPLKAFAIPVAPSYETVAPTQLSNENKPGDIDGIPKKLIAIAKPDLSGLSVPSEN